MSAGFPDHPDAEAKPLNLKCFGSSVAIEKTFWLPRLAKKHTLTFGYLTHKPIFSLHPETTRKYF